MSCFVSCLLISIVVFVLMLAVAAYLIFRYSNSYLNNLFKCGNNRVDDIPAKIVQSTASYVLAIHCKKSYDLYCTNTTTTEWVPKDWKLLTIFPRTAGYMLRNQNSKQVLLVFRGTYTSHDILTDGDSVQTPCPFVQGKVHKGFLDSYQRVRAEVRDQLSHYKEDWTIYVTGHSLGAAVAAISYLDLHAEYKNNMQVVLFACPKFGDDTLMENAFENCLVFQNLADVIPLSPPGIKVAWKPFSSAIVKSFTTDRGSWLKNHSIDVYVEHVRTATDHSEM